jgi:hypothetical protein
MKLRSSRCGSPMSWPRALTSGQVSNHGADGNHISPADVCRNHLVQRCSATASCALGASNVLAAMLFGLQAIGKLRTVGDPAILQGVVPRSFAFIAPALTAAPRILANGEIPYRNWRCR